MKIKLVGDEEKVRLTRMDRHVVEHMLRIIAAANDPLWVEMVEELHQIMLHGGPDGITIIAGAVAVVGTPAA